MSGITDIVEQLRDPDLQKYSLLQKAADEIERLRALARGHMHRRRKAEIEVKQLRELVQDMRAENIFRFSVRMENRIDSALGNEP